MDVSHILHELNEAQRQAVTAPLGNQLILAGAGSGKTRVLVHRIAWLLEVEKLYPSSILAVTFTNKAANEMRSRVEALLKTSTKSMWIGTFHSLAHRLLRMHWRDANLMENFQVLDSEDQFRLIRRIVRELNLDEDQWSPKQAQWFINGKKDAGKRAKDIKTTDDIYVRVMTRIYQAYENACEQGGLVDFAELLLRAYELWQNNPSLREHYQQRFKQILVDEFQDTNGIQYAWIKLLAHDNNDVTIVGDDDQSIYGWRGAEVENIQRVLQDFSNTTTIRLEQNYRSTSTILGAANALIAHNIKRMGKKLWTDGHQGEPILVYQAFNELDEARYAVGVINQWIAEGQRCDETAILYRSNAQSRVIEEALIQAGIAYRIYGGLRFFERAEIKDVLAYLRLMLNEHHDAAFERIVNTPTRGIGNTTMNHLRDYAREKQISLWRAAEENLKESILSARAKNALNHFLDLITSLKQDTVNLELGLLTEHVLEISGLLNHYRKEKGEKGRARVENLQELVTAARVFRPEDDDESFLSAFLNHAALEAGDNQSNAFEDCVQMMTLHSAKGLEFPLVIMTGMEDGLFPHQMSYEEPGRLAEERRLCYVGITRAKKKLVLTYAETRRLHGREMYHRASRFIREIPQKFLQEVRLKSQVSRPTIITAAESFNFNQDIEFGFDVGSVVQHKKFGEGVVTAIEGQGDNARIQVKFQGIGHKWLIASFLETA